MSQGQCVCLCLEGGSWKEVLKNLLFLPEGKAESCHVRKRLEQGQNRKGTVIQEPGREVIRGASNREQKAKAEVGERFSKEGG